MNWLALKESIRKLLNGRNLSNPNIRLNALNRLEEVIKTHFIDIYNNPSALSKIDKNDFKKMLSKYKILNSAEESIINNFYQIIDNTSTRSRDSNCQTFLQKEKRGNRKNKPLIVNSIGELINPIFGLRPIINNETRILILGTFPAKESIEGKLYYQNQIKSFWGQALSTIGSFENITNEKRRKLLLYNKIGLWDIFECVERERGNKDKDIKKAKYNDIESLLNTYPSVEYLVFNGKNAYLWLTKDKPNLFRRNKLETKRLQSSSGCNRRWFNKGFDWEVFFKEIGY